MLIEDLEKRLPDCQSGDQFRFRRRLAAQRKKKPGGDQAKALNQLAKEIQQSVRACQARDMAIPRQMCYPAELPVSENASKLVQLIRDHQVLIVAGDTGSGKTTQLPKICLEAGLGRRGLIGHTQPRRLAASSVAARIAEELGTEVGKGIGFQVRFSERTAPETYLKVMTDGILLAEIQQDRFLNRYEALIIDEAHERSLNIDFLLGYLKGLLRRRPDLKLIVTSATIDVEKFSAHFDDAPIMRISGRTFPVEIEYAPLTTDAEKLNQPETMAEAVVSAAKRIRERDSELKQHTGDVLVFLATEREIRDTAQALRRARLPDTEILPLYARLRQSEQARIFTAHKGRRIVLSTNVAETSITVPGINYVIDTGLARISRYSIQSKIQRLPIERISQASANQRKGRCGRLAEGFCIRLYSEADFESRHEFTDPEIMRTNLASVILRMLSLKIGDITKFPFLEAPESRAVNDGFKLLEELNAIDGKKQLTQAGRQMASLPVDPKLARMLVAANAQGCLSELLIIVSALSIQDPREQGAGSKEQAEEARHEFRHPDSDFLSFKNLWDSYEEIRQSASQSQLRKYCKTYHLSYMRMREWREVHRQLLVTCQQLKFRMNREPAEYSSVHKAILSGAISQVACHQEGKVYQGVRNKKFLLIKSSALAGRRPRWIVTSGLIETSQAFASVAAKIEPEWAEEAALHLVKSEIYEPHWSKKRQQVIAYEKISLLGLTLIEKRVIPCRKLDPELARELFIKQGLVTDEVVLKSPLLAHNRRFLKQLEKEEEKLRRPELLLSERDIYRFYEKALPSQVASTAELAHWLKTASAQETSKLEMTRSNLVESEKAYPDESFFPDQAAIHNNKLKLNYQFKPGHDRDGATLEVPRAVLTQLRQSDLDWAVPGILRDRSIALLKTLPKSLRKQLIPISGFVDSILPQMAAGDGDFISALCMQIRRAKGISLCASDFDENRLPAHLRLKIKVLDSKGKEVGYATDLKALQQEHAGERHSAEVNDSGLFGHELECTGMRDWECGDLPESVSLGEELVLVRYPALVDEKTSVGVRLFAEEDRAMASHHKGLLRLYMLKNAQLKKAAKKQLEHFQQKHVLKFPPGMSNLPTEAVAASYVKAFAVREKSIRSRAAFSAQYDDCRGELITWVNRLEALLEKILEGRLSVQRQLSRLRSGREHYAADDVESQLHQLLRAGFVVDTAWEWLEQYPRYIQAILKRLESAPHLGARDQELTVNIQSYWRRYEAQSDQKHTEKQPEVDLLRWMIEEYRVSCFAQSLGTKFPVSEKRLEKLIRSFEG